MDLLAQEIVMLPAEPASAARARRLVQEVLLRVGREDCLEVAELACTELVANAVLHAHTPVELTIAVGSDVLVQVRDFNIALPTQRTYDNHATTGRGLALVAALSDEHGITEAGPDGKAVWFRVGGGRQRSEEELASAWVDAEWDLDGLLPAATDARPTRHVQLLGLPPALWIASRQHHDAILRELALYVSRRPVPGVDMVGTDLARSTVSAAILNGFDVSERFPGGAASGVRPAGMLWVPEPVDLHLEVPPDSARACRAMQQTLDAAERLARSGRLLVRPGLPEVVALRDWICEQVISQLAGDEPQPWRAEEWEADASSGETTWLQGPRDADLSIFHTSRRGVVAADDSNRIVAVSPRVAELTGWTVEELVGRRVLALVPVRMREAHSAGYTRHLSTGEAHVLGVPLTLPVLCADGSELMCSVLVEQSHSASGRALYVAWIEPVQQPAQEPGVDYAAIFRSLPTPYLVMDRDMVIVEANDAYLRQVGRTRHSIVGRPVFEAFPPTPDALGPDGRPRVLASFERARDSGTPDTMPIEKYAIADPVTGRLTERHWSLISVPVLDTDGRTSLIAQRAEDITEFVREREDRGDESGSWRRRVEEVEADLFARASELTAALAGQEETARRLAVLAEGAALLTAAETLEDVESIIVRRGLAALGADGGALLLSDVTGGWRVWASGSRPGDPSMRGGMVFPYESPGPAAWTARTGQRLLLPTRASGMAFDAAVMKDLYDGTGRQGWAFVPLVVRGQTIGSLSVGWGEEHQTSRDELELLDALAAQLSQALGRIRATQAERVAAEESQRLSETLQRSMLTDPPRSPGVRVAVRYQPAAEQAEVGGDWYDAFVTADGRTAFVVGDVAGHDRAAAALMGQVRNLLRGIAYDSKEGAAVLLARLDAAMEGLRLGTVATAVLAVLEPDGRRRGDVTRRLRWSNAGHPAPLLRSADGAVHVMSQSADAPLGSVSEPGRREHVVDLPVGCTLVLYTDGLVERSGAPIQDGVDRLVGIVAEAGDADPERLADAIMERLGPGSGDDDLALLVLRIG